MKPPRRPALLVVLTAFSLAVAGCVDNYYFGLVPFIPENLISNGSFETARSASLRGWSLPNGDSSGVTFSGDVPPSGGRHSVSLLNQWTVPGTIEQGVAPKPGIHRYRLSAWGKAVRPGALPAGGEMALLTIKRDAMVQHASLHFADTTWRKGELTAVISSIEADAIVVRFRGNIDQFSQGYALFDLCTLVADRP